MERQTMGKFIAALRKANGMTQQDLADKLNVSNKSVSKWERDAGYPDLSLIPVIAEVFGVTSDEILKGARAVEESAVEDRAALAGLLDQQTQKIEKRFNYLVQRKLNRFNYLSLISLFLTVASFVMLWFSSFSYFDALSIFCVGCGALSIFLQYAFMSLTKNALYCPELSEDTDMRILRAVNKVETHSFKIFAADAVILFDVFMFYILAGVDSMIGYTFTQLIFFLATTPALCLVAYLIKMLTSDRKYYDLVDCPEVAVKLKKLQISCLAAGGGALLVVVVLHVLGKALAFLETGLSYIPPLVFCLLYSLIVAVAALVCIANRKELLRKYSLLK